jgi:hypothetical protein
LDQWENSVYSEVPEIFANSEEVLRTPFPLLLPLSPALLPCSASLPPVSALLPVAPAAPRRHLQLLAVPRVTWTPATALAPSPWPSRMRATPPRGSAVHHLAAAAVAHARPLAPSFMVQEHH